jgi:membrane protease YdiL (CAAX protease family)
MDKKDKLQFLFLPVIVIDIFYLILFGFLYPIYSNYATYMFLFLLIGGIGLVVIEWIFFFLLYLKLKSKNMTIKDIWIQEARSKKDLMLYGSIYFVALAGLGILLILYYRSLGNVSNTFPLLILYIFVSISTGIVEETIWRSYAFWEMRFKFGSKWKAIIFSSLSFALFHGFEPLSIIFGFIIGIIACLIFDKIKNTYPLIIAHIAADLIAWILYFL